VRLLVLSDIHGNWPALEAILRAEPEPQAIAFCGDVVDYGPYPVERTVAALRAAPLSEHVIEGLTSVLAGR
jgi:predicted phosphodiesterase